MSISAENLILSSPYSSEVTLGANILDFEVLDDVATSQTPGYFDPIVSMLNSFDVVRLVCSNGVWTGLVTKTGGVISVTPLMTSVEEPQMPVPVVNVSGSISTPDGWVVDKVVTFTPPTWIGEVDTVAAWITRDGVEGENLPSATSIQNYTIMAADEGFVLGVTYVASNSSGDSIPEVYEAAVEVAPAPPAPEFLQTFWGQNADNPGKADPGDAETYTLGWVFSVTEDAKLKKIRWRKPVGEGRNSRTMGLFNSAGVLLAQTSTADEPASGWLEAPLPVEVDLVANVSYKAAVLVTNGYSIGPSFAPDVTHERIVGENGFYLASTTFGNPTSGTGQTNYYLDVEVAFATEWEGEDPEEPPTTTYPDASTTGVPAGTVLTQYTGPMTITVPGTVIEDKVINGTLNILAADVMIRRCRLQYSGNWGIDGDSNNATNLSVHDCDLIGPGVNGTANAAILGRGSFLRNDISQSENGIVLKDGASTVRRNYIHDLNAAGSDPHYDGISVQGGQNGVLIEENTVSARDTSDIFIKNDFGNIQNVTVNNNLLIGNPGFALYVDNRGNSGQILGGIVISNNKVKRGFYGYFAIENHNPTVTGNVDYLTGAPVN